MTTTRLAYFNNQELPAWVVSDLKDDTGTQYDMSSGWTFTVTLARTTAPATALAIKSTGITATSTAVTVAWSTSDWSGLEASVNGTSYVVILQAVRTSDGYSIAYRPASPPTLLLKAAPGTSAVSPSSYPVTVTAASVTVADTGGYYTGTNVETVLAELPSRYLPIQTVERVAISPELSTVTFITKFASGHGWTVIKASTATHDLDATDRPLLSQQAYKYGPSDPGDFTEVMSPVVSLNLTDKTLCVWVYTPDANTGGFEVRLGADSNFIDYQSHTFLSTDIEPGRLCCIKVNTARPNGTGGSLNLASVGRVKIRVLDPAGTHTLYIGGLGYIPEQTTYPTGALTIGFDDTDNGLWQYAMPRLSAYGYPCNVYAIGENVENATATGPTLDNLHFAQQALGWDIGGHADRDADHVDLTTLTDAQVEDKIGRMKAWLNRNGFAGRHFAYPFGSNNLAVRDIARKYFTTARTVDGNTGQPQSYHEPPLTNRLMRLSAPSFSSTGPTYTLAGLQTAITLAVTRQVHLNIILHDVTTAASSGDSISTTDLDTLLAHIAASGIRVVTLSTLLGLNSYDGGNP